MRFAYMRVSSTDDRQKFDMQKMALDKIGYDKLFMDKGTGSNFNNRPEFLKMLEQLRPGDVVICYRIDRISRSTVDLLNLMNDFNSKNIQFISTEDNIDTTTPGGILFFTIMASLAEFEKNLMVARIKNGIQAAKAKGTKFGRKTADEKKLEMAFEMYDQKVWSVKRICDELEIGRTTFYKYLKMREDISC